MNGMVTYYFYNPGSGLYQNCVELPIEAPQPAFATLDAPIGAQEGQIYRRADRQWIIEAAEDTPVSDPEPTQGELPL